LSSAPSTPTADETLVEVLRGTVEAVEAELVQLSETQQPDSHSMHVLRSLRRQLEASLQALTHGGDAVAEPGSGDPSAGPGRRR
jgi:hypothetical protein